MTLARHRVLVVGAGSIGHRHIRCFLATGRADVAFVEPSATLREEVSLCNPDAVPYASLDQALESQSFAAAVIATPAPLHIPQSLRLLAQKVHLLIEKPLCLDWESAAELFAVAVETDVVVAVAYVYRANPVLSAMRNELRSGKRGRPLELIAVTGQHFPSFRPAFQNTYYRQRTTGGGAIQDALTHVYNAAEWLIGDIKRLVVDADRLHLEGVEVEDTVHVLARHDDDIMASYSLNQHQPANEMSLTVITDKSMLRWESHRHRYRIFDHSMSEWEDREFPPLERDELFVRQANAFLDSVENGTPPPCDLPEGMSTLRANLASLKSLETGRWEYPRKSHAIINAG